ncbi:MAG: sodium:solute symporter [Gemmataceae bacterium]|nr:sodium:solute symporter [Gemmataceae bacterium]
MRSLHPVDLAIVIAYLAGTTLLAMWFARGQRDTRTYFVGDRNVAWWLVLVSIVATETSTVTFLSAPGLAFNPEGGNLTFLQLTLGYLIGRILVAWLLLPQYMRGELFSAYQLLRQRFDVRVQRVASAIFLGTRTVADGLRLCLTSLLLQQFTGWNIAVSIAVMSAVTIFYTYLGGMQAVIWTDLVQFVIYIAGAIVAAVFIVQLLPDGVRALIDTADSVGKLTVLDLSTDPTRPFTLWAGCIGGAFLSMASHGADHLMVQRYLCSRSLGEARTALVLSGFVIIAQFALFLLIGVGLFALASYRVLVMPPGTKPDAVFGLFIVHHMPVGLVGLIVAAVLAAAMSTLSSSLNSSAGAFVADFYRPLKPGQTEEHYLAISKIMTLFWGVGQGAVALGALALGSGAIIEKVLTIAGFTTGIVLGLFLLGSMRRPVRSEAALAGVACGFSAVLALWLPSTRGTTLLAWPWFAPVGAVTTVAVALLADKVVGTLRVPSP